MSSATTDVLPDGISRKMRDGKPAFSRDGSELFRVRVWDATLKKQVERTAKGLDAAKDLLAEFAEAKHSRPGRLQAQRVRVNEVAARYLVAYKVRRDGTPRPKSSLAKDLNYLNAHVLPVIGNAWIGDLDLPDLNDLVRNMTRNDGKPAAPGTKGTCAAVIRRMFAWAREERIIPYNPALELRTGWGAPVRRRIVIPSIPQVQRLAKAVDSFKPGLGDVVLVLAFCGLRWEEVVAVRVEDVDLASQTMLIWRTASESGGKRDTRDETKTAAGERTIVIPDIAVPAVGRLLAKGAKGRELAKARAGDGGKRFVRLVNGDRGGYLGYATWRKYLGYAHGYTASHPDGMIKYTAHELRHVCASLLIASGATDMQICNQMGHKRIETTKNIYGHLFATDRGDLLKAVNAAVSRLTVQEDASDGEGEDGLAVAV